MKLIYEADSLLKIKNEAIANGSNFIKLLQNTLGVDNDLFIEWLSTLSSHPSIDLSELNASKSDFEIITFSDSIQHECLAIRDVDDQLRVIIADPFNEILKSWIFAHVKEPFNFAVAHSDNIKFFLTQQENSQRAIKTLTSSNIEASLENDIEAISIKSISEDSSTVVKVVHATLYDALKEGVSDIHLETNQAGLVIKYRIDGILSYVSEFKSLETADQIISRLKVMSELDISERRTPQDGRFKIQIEDRTIDFRVSIMPNIFGEDAVLRILDKRNLTGEHGLNLESLGFSGSSLEKLRRMCREPYGMILVTGPTGSGKTTTLYAAVSEINNGTDKIITIEDPVEYQLPGILQIPVNEKKGLTFARGLRSILRHDPDKILVGEIRDAETAQIAIQSALTGHLVFTTVHANNVFDVISRFIHMGVDPYSFVSALNVIVAQRLIRVNCQSCSSKYIPSKELIEYSRIDSNDIENFNFIKGQGCKECRGTGFKGRKAIAELLLLNDELREMIVNRDSVKAIKAFAQKQNTKLLRFSALDLVKNGETTLEEINRVTFIE